VLPTTVPLTPNQQRALRYAESSMEDIRRQKGLPPYIVMSNPGGTYLVNPNGTLRPGDAPPSVVRPATAQAPTVRAQAPAAEVVASASDPVAGRKPPHAAWITPSPAKLAEIVGGK
jgi:hypothetical protein